MEDEIDIYEGLPSFDSSECVKLKEEIEKLSQRCTNFQQEISELNLKIAELTEANKTLSINASSLMKTAKAEISRKDRMITELRQELDNATFRRNGYVKPKVPKAPAVSVSHRPAPSVHPLVIPIRMQSTMQLDFGHEPDNPDQKYEPEKFTSTVFGRRLKQKILMEEEVEKKQKEDAKLAESEKNGAAAKLAESEKNAAAAKLAESEKNAAAAKLAESEKNAAAAKLAESEKNAAAANLAESEKNAAAAKLAESEKNAAAAKLAESEKNAVAAKLAESAKNATAAKLYSQVTAETPTASAVDKQTPRVAVNGAPKKAGISGEPSVAPTDRSGLKFFKEDERSLCERRQLDENISAKRKPKDIAYPDQKRRKTEDSSCNSEKSKHYDEVVKSESRSNSEMKDNCRSSRNCSTSGNYRQGSNNRVESERTRQNYSERSKTNYRSRSRTPDRRFVEKRSDRHRTDKYRAYMDESEKRRRSGSRRDNDYRDKFGKDKYDSRGKIEHRVEPKIGSRSAYDDHKYSNVDRDFRRIGRESVSSERAGSRSKGDPRVKTFDKNQERRSKSSDRSTVAKTGIKSSTKNEGAIARSGDSKSNITNGKTRNPEKNVDKTSRTESSDGETNKRPVASALSSVGFTKQEPKERVASVGPIPNGSSQVSTFNKIAEAAQRQRKETKTKSTKPETIVAAVEQCVDAEIKSQTPLITNSNEEVTNKKVVFLPKIAEAPALELESKNRGTENAIDRQSSGSETRIGQNVVDQDDNPSEWKCSVVNNDTKIPVEIGRRSFREEKIENIEIFIRNYDDDENFHSQIAKTESLDGENKSCFSTSSILDTLSTDMEDRSVEIRTADDSLISQQILLNSLLTPTKKSDPSLPSNGTQQSPLPSVSSQDKTEQPPLPSISPPDGRKQPPLPTISPPGEIKQPPLPTVSPPDETKKPPLPTISPPDETNKPPLPPISPPDETKKPPLPPISPADEPKQSSPPTITLPDDAEKPALPPISPPDETKQPPLPPIPPDETEEPPLPPISPPDETKQPPLPPISPPDQTKKPPLLLITPPDETKQLPLLLITSPDGTEKPPLPSISPPDETNKSSLPPISPPATTKQPTLPTISRPDETKNPPLPPISTLDETRKPSLAPISPPNEPKQPPLPPISPPNEPKQPPLPPISPLDETKLISVPRTPPSHETKQLLPSSFSSPNETEQPLVPSIPTPKETKQPTEPPIPHLTAMEQAPSSPISDTNNEKPSTDSRPTHIPDETRSQSLPSILASDKNQKIVLSSLLPSPDVQRKTTSPIITSEKGKQNLPALLVLNEKEKNLPGLSILNDKEQNLPSLSVSDEKENNVHCRSSPDHEEQTPPLLPSPNDEEPRLSMRQSSPDNTKQRPLPSLSSLDKKTEKPSSPHPVSDDDKVLPSTPLTALATAEQREPLSTTPDSDDQSKTPQQSLSSTDPQKNSSASQAPNKTDVVIEITSTKEIFAIKTDRENDRTEKIVTKQITRRPRIPCTSILSRYSRKRRDMVLADSTASQYIVKSDSSSEMEMIISANVEMEVVNISMTKHVNVIAKPITHLESNDDASGNVNNDDKSKNETPNKMAATVNGSVRENGCENGSIRTNETAECLTSKKIDETSKIVGPTITGHGIQRSAKNFEKNSKKLQQYNGSDEKMVLPKIQNSDTRSETENSICSKSVDGRETRSALKSMARPISIGDGTGGSSNRKRPLPKEKENQSKQAAKQCKIMVVARRRRPVHLEDSSVVTTLVTSARDTNCGDRSTTKIKNVQSNSANDEKLETAESVAVTGIKRRKRRSADK